MFKRSEPISPSRQARNELTEGLGHLKSATTCAAQGAAQSVSPRINSMLTVVGIRKKRAPRWPWYTGAAVLAGTAAGVGGVLWYRTRSNHHDERAAAESPEDIEAGQPLEHAGHAEFGHGGAGSNHAGSDAELSPELVDSVTR